MMAQIDHGPVNEDVTVISVENVGSWVFRLLLLQALCRGHCYKYSGRGSGKAQDMDDHIRVGACRLRGIYSPCEEICRC